MFNLASEAVVFFGILVDSVASLGVEQELLPLTFRVVWCVYVEAR